MSPSSYKKRDCSDDHAVLSIKMEYPHCVLIGKYDNNMTQVYYTNKELLCCQNDLYKHFFVYWEKMLSTFANALVIPRKSKTIFKCKDAFFLIYYQYVYMMSIIFMNANILLAWFLRRVLLGCFFLFYTGLLKKVREEVYCRAYQQIGQEGIRGMKENNREWFLKKQKCKGYINCLERERKILFEKRKRRKLYDYGEHKTCTCKACEYKRESNVEFVKVKKRNKKKKKTKKKNVWESWIIHKYNTFYKINTSNKRRPHCVTTVRVFLIRTLFEQREKQTTGKNLCMCYERITKNWKEKHCKDGKYKYNGNDSYIVRRLGEETYILNLLREEEASVKNYSRIAKKMISINGSVRCDKNYNIHKDIMHTIANFTNPLNDILERRTWGLPFCRRERTTLRWCVRRKRLKVDLLVDSGERHVLWHRKLKEINECGEGNEDEGRAQQEPLNMWFDTPQSKRVNIQKNFSGRTYNLYLYKCNYRERCGKRIALGNEYLKINIFLNVMSVHKKHKTDRFFENEKASVSCFLIKKNKKGTSLLQYPFDRNHKFFIFRQQMKTDVSEVWFNFLLSQINENIKMNQVFLYDISSTNINTELKIFCASNHQNRSVDQNKDLLYDHCEKPKDNNLELSQLEGKQTICMNMRVEFERRKIKIVNSNEYNKLYKQLIKKILCFVIIYVSRKSKGCIVQKPLEKRRKKRTLQRKINIKKVALTSFEGKLKKKNMYNRNDIYVAVVRMHVVRKLLFFTKLLNYMTTKKIIIYVDVLLNDANYSSLICQHGFVCRYIKKYLYFWEQTIITTAVVKEKRNSNITLMHVMGINGSKGNMIQCSGSNENNNSNNNENTSSSNNSNINGGENNYDRGSDRSRSSSNNRSNKFVGGSSNGNNNNEDNNNNDDNNNNNRNNRSMNDNEQDEGRSNRKGKTCKKRNNEGENKREENKGGSSEKKWIKEHQVKRETAGKDDTRDMGDEPEKKEEKNKDKTREKNTENEKEETGEKEGETERENEIELINKNAKEKEKETETGKKKEKEKETETETETETDKEKDKEKRNRRRRERSRARYRGKSEATNNLKTREKPTQETICSAAEIVKNSMTTTAKFEDVEEKKEKQNDEKDIETGKKKKRSKKRNGSNSQKYVL